MTYLLDANICIDYFRKRGSGALERALAAVPPSEIALCSIVVAELMGGAYGATDPTAEQRKVAELRALFRSLPFDDAAADHAGRVYGHLRSRGEKIGQSDLFIAAIALSNNLTLITRNLSEFRRVPGLKVDDWKSGP